jgi:hypothetical protein
MAIFSMAAHARIRQRGAMPAPKPRPTIPRVPSDTWAALYRAADELRALALWECMGDSELLCIEDERTGGTMLGAVMGGAGEVFGLAIYHGEDGCRMVLEAALGENEASPMENFHLTSVLKVEFVPKAELAAEEKRRVKQLGFRPAIQSPQWWPTFQSMRPGCVPWHLDEAEAELLLHVLPRLTALGACVRPLFEGDDVLPADGFAFWPRGRAPGEPLRPEEVEWRKLAVPAWRAPEPFTVDEVTAARLAALPPEPALALELDAQAGFTPIGEGERPWYMKTGLAAEVRTGVIAGMGMGENAADPLEAIAGRALVQAITALGKRPGKVRVQKERIAIALAPLAERLGVKIETRKTLPMIDEAMASMSAQMGMGFPGM